MRAVLCHRGWLVVWGLLCSMAAAAQSFEFSAYIDADGRPNTGCSVTLSDGTVLPGIEQQVIATAQGLPPTVTEVRRRSCAGGVLALAQTTPTSYAVGLNNGTNGGDVVEFAVPRSAVVPTNSRGIRLYFVGESVPLGGLDLLLTQNGDANGGPIFFGFAVSIPGLTQWGLLLLSLLLATVGFVVLRRHPHARNLVVLLVLGSGTLTALAVSMKSADGQIGDWAGISALATDPAGDGTTPEAGNDLLAAFLQIEGADLLFRIDVLDLENQPPVAVSQAVTTLEDNFVDIVLSATDPEGSALVFTILTPPTQGTLGPVTQLTPNTAGVRYTPNVDRNGADSFTFAATDSGGAGSAAATVSISITPVNDAPQFTAQNPPVVLEDAGPQTATVATGIAAGPPTAVDEVGQTLSFNIVSNDNAALFSVAPTISPTGVLSYTAAPDANGTATLSVTLSDNGSVANGGVNVSAAQNIVITVTAVNDAPVNVVPGAQTILEDATLVFSSGNGNAISTSDVDAGANPVALGLSTPNGTLTLSTLVGLTGTGNGTGTLSYTGTIASINTALDGLSFVPTLNFNGATAVAISVDDQGNTGGPAQSDTDAVVINITPVNDIPSFTGGAAQVRLEDAGAQTVNGWATAITDGDPEVQGLTFSFTANDNAALFSAGPAVDPATGNLTFTSAPDAFGVANLTLVLIDDGGTDNGGLNTSLPFSFTITIDPVNDAPSFTASNPATVLEDAGPQTLVGWATFSPGPANESAQTVVGYTVSAIGTPALFSAPPAVANNGTLTYTPAPDANGTSTFSVTVQDSGGVANGGVDVSAVQTFTITVTAVNDAPSFTGGASQVVLEDAGPQTVAGWATAINDGDPEVAQPLNFVFTANDNPTLFSAGPAVNPANGNLTYTPAANAFGVANLTVVLDDGQGANNLSAPYNFTITVTAVDDPPVAVNDAATVNEDSGANAINVLANDTDIDGGPISIGLVTQPANGTVVITGGGTGLTYQPNADYCNTAPVAPADTFTYTLNPGGSAATVSVTVTCVNDAPVNTLPVTQNIGAGGTLVFNVVNANLISIADVDAGTGIISINLSTGGAGNGVVTLTDLGGLSTVTGNGTGTVAATGTLTAINASLEGMSYTAPAIPPGSGNVILTLITDDQGNTGTGGPQTDTDGLQINIDNAPSVILVSPTAGASNQGTGTAVTVTFSEPVAAAAGALNVTCAPSGGSANSAGNANTTTLSVTGAAIAAQPGDTCTVTVTAASITDIDTIDPPDNMLANFVSTYTIDTPPSVTSSTPANGATNVAAGATITVNFSENVSVAAGGFALACSSGPALTLNPTTLTDANTVVLTPSAPLPPTSSCTLTVDANLVTDSDAGDPPDNMLANYVASFTTVDPAPEVTTTVPADGGAISAASDLTINFSEPVNFTAGSFTLECPVATAIPFTVSGSGTAVATINPDVNLPVGTLCTVTVLALQISDVDLIDPPDNMLANFVFSFTPVNNPPVLTAGATANYTEDGPAVVIDNTITVTDLDNANLVSATVSLTTNFATGEDLLNFVNTPNITGNYVGATGVLTLTGSDTLANYQAALRSVTYSNSSDTPSTAPRTISWIGNDGIAPSTAVTSTVNVAATDDPPVAVPDAATVIEDSGANAINVLANDTDVDGGPIAVFSVTQPVNGTVVITGGGTGLTYAPNPDYCNTPPGTTLDTFNYTLAPGSSSTTVTVTVTCVDDDPVAVADSATVLEDSGANAINVLANDTDVDGGPISITSVTQPPNGVVVITGGGTGVTYAPNPDYCNAPPGTTPDTFNYTLAPGGSSAVVSVTVTCVDDPPVAVADSATVLEDSGATAINVLANDTDIDGGPISITSVTQPINGVVVITGGGTGLTYAPNPDYCNDPPGTTPDTFTYTLAPGGSVATVTMTVTCVNDPPVFTNNPITYIAAGNTQLHVQGATLAGMTNTVDTEGVLTKSLPTDVDGPVAPAAVAATGLSANGGNFAVAANGSFTYVPPAGFAGADSFIVQVTDSMDSAPLTVNITVSEVVWYVRDLIDVNNPIGGDGRSSNAFQTLADVQAAAGDGHIIYIFEGSTAATPLPGGITLRNGQRLWGRGIALTLPTHGTLVAAGTRPRITNATAGENGVTVLANTANGNRTGVEIRGLSIGGNANAIDATSANAANLGIRISENIIESAGAEGIDINQGSTGTAVLAVHNNAVTATGNGIDIQRTAGTATITTFNDNSVSGDTGGTGINMLDVIFDATPGNPINAVAGGNTSVGQSGNGVGINGVFLNNVRGELSFTDLDIFNDAGTGLFVTSGGALDAAAGTGFRISVPASVSVIDANGGPAVNVNNASVTLPLQLLESTNSGTTGLSLVNAFGGVGQTALSAASGSISTATGVAVNINSGNGNVTLGIPITNTASSVVLVTARTSDTVAFNGAINDTGNGILLTNNTGATINFTGGVTVSSGAAGAFSATGGGTISVTGAANTLATTTATALNVVNTTIGAAGITLRSVNSTVASGATAIILTNTGAGAFSVTGTGAAGTGGTISNKTVDAVQLNTTGGLVTLNQMIIQDIGDMGGGIDTRSGHDAIQGLNVNAGLSLTNTTIRRISDQAIHGGIHGGGVDTPTVWNGLTLSGVTIENTNRYHVAGNGDANNESTVRILGARGTVNVTNSTFSLGSQPLDLEVTAGTLNLTATGNNFDRSYKEFTSGVRASIGNHCIDVRVLAGGTANVVIGDRANPALGNNFLNCRLGSIRVVNQPGAGANTDAIIARNNFRVNDHSSGIGGDFDFPMGGTLVWNLGSGTVDTIVENNLFELVTNASGGVGQLSLIAEGGPVQALVQANTFDRPGNAPWWVQARNSAAAVMTARFIGNTVIRGPFPCTTDPACGGGYFGPGLRALADANTGATMNFTMQNNIMARHDFVFDPGQTVEVRALNSGAAPTVCANLQNNQSPDGYSLEQLLGTVRTVGAGTCVAGNPSPTCQTVLQNNGNQGSGGVGTAVPPFVNVLGTVTVSGVACPVPTGVPF